MRLLGSSFEAIGMLEGEYIPESRQSQHRTGREDTSNPVALAEAATGEVEVAKSSIPVQESSRSPAIIAGRRA